MGVLVGRLTTGLSLVSILLLAALGLSLTFGQMGVINMAHGEFIMAVCHTAYVVQYYILESGRVTSSGAGGSASEADVRAAMAI